MRFVLFAHFILFYYRKGKNTQTQRKICVAYRKDAETDRTTVKLDLQDSVEVM